MKKEQKIINLLIINNLTLSVAESCTGGLLTNRLTNIPGCSNILKGSIIAYSNDIKSKALKIDERLIKKYGAVSSEVALAMAKNIRKLLLSDFGIGITGIAGPTGGSALKPIGLVFISIATNNEALCLECQFKGTRQSIKSQSVTQAFKILLEFLGE